MTSEIKETESQFELLKQRRFLPFFITQFLGAFNDNAFKNALVIMIAFHSAGATGDSSQVLVNLSAALFILPFFLFSSTAGQLGDRYEKSRLIRSIKFAEIMIMLVAAIGFYLQSVVVLMTVLFFMGTQSAVFGPVKYGYLPQQLGEHELVGGNGLVEMGTFLAILFGMIVGSYLMTTDMARVWIALLIVSVAISGYLGSRHIPPTPAVQPDLTINWNVFTQTWRSIQLTRQNRSVFLSIIAISWFWFLGSTYMVQLPNYTRSILGANEGVYILLMTVFCVGIGLGSVLCESLSRHRIETGLIPLGAIGLTAFGLDLYFAAPEQVTGKLAGVSDFISQAGQWRIVIDIIGIGMFGGFYIVPLFAVVQQRTERAVLSRVIAGNNILNALFMVVAAIFAIGVLSLPDVHENDLFLYLALMNAVVIGLILYLVPEFFQRFIGWLRNWLYPNA